MFSSVYNLGVLKYYILQDLFYFLSVYSLCVSKILYFAELTLFFQMFITLIFSKILYFAGLTLCFKDL